MNEENNMSRIERILALEAALCACKDIIPKGKSIREFLNDEIETNFVNSNFAEFIAAQKAAVAKLNECPEVFGGI